MHARAVLLFVVAVAVAAIAAALYAVPACAVVTPQGVRDDQLDMVQKFLQTHLHQHHVLLQQNVEVAPCNKRAAGQSSQLCISFQLEMEWLSFRVSPLRHLINHGVKVFAISANGTRQVNHDVDIMWGDGGGNQFRIEEGRLVGGRLRHNGTTFALEPLLSLLTWESLPEQEKATLFGGDQFMFASALDGVLFAYHHLSMKFPHNLHSPDGLQHTAFSQCDQAGLAQRAEQIHQREQRRAVAADGEELRTGKAGSRKRRGALDEGRRTCFVSLVGDYKFYQSKGSNLATTVNDMVEYATYVNNNFRATNFGGYTDIGIAIHGIYVFEDSGSDPYYLASTWDVIELLEEFSLAPAAPLDWSAVCLAHLFTHQDFSNGVQGLAWVGNSRNGGICDGFGTSRDSYLNTGLTTGINWGSNLLKLSLELTMQHELGHNFGSPHDDPENPTCAPNGNFYVMYATSVDGSQSNNALFSSCSISSISTNLPSKSSCFSAAPANICGNGNLEVAGADGEEGTDDDEECDEGYSGGACCTTDCKLKSGAVCSDDNFECCADCQATAGVKCYQGFEEDSLCRDDSFCVISSFSCPEPPPKTNGSLCTNSGFCLEVAAEEDRCRSFCEYFGAEECACASGSDDECALCCLNDPSAAILFCPDGYTWSRTEDMCVNDMDGNDKVAGIRPFNSTCAAAYQVLSDPAYAHARTVSGDIITKANVALTPGLLCSAGVCNDAGECEQPSDDFASKIFSFFAEFSLTDAKKWILRNIIPTVIIFSILVYLPLALWMAKKDRLAREELLRKQQALEKNRRQSSAVRKQRTSPHHPQRGQSSSGGKYDGYSYDNYKRMDRDTRRLSSGKTVGGYRLRDAAKVYPSANKSRVAPSDYYEQRRQRRQTAQMHWGDGYSSDSSSFA